MGDTDINSPTLIHIELSWNARMWWMEKNVKCENNNVKILLFAETRIKWQKKELSRGLKSRS
jgi:hypothetical protein